jgi:hypothetical protein
VTQRPSGESFTAFGAAPPIAGLPKTRVRERGSVARGFASSAIAEPPQTASIIATIQNRRIPLLHKENIGAK